MTTPQEKPAEAPKRHHIREVPGQTKPAPAPPAWPTPTPSEKKAAATARAPAAKKPRKSRAKPGRVTKVDRVISLLSRPGGATMAEIATDIGWKEDSLRGFFAATLRGKRQLTIVSAKEEGRGRVYRIAAPAPADVPEAI